MKKIIILTIAIGAIIFGVSSASAEMFKYIDENGNMHFVDGVDKIPAKYREKVNDYTPSGSLSITSPAEPEPKPTTREKSRAKTLYINRVPAKKVEDKSVSDRGKRHNGDDFDPKEFKKKKVELFTTSWCGYCQKARDWFAKYKVKYTEYDVEKNKSAARRKEELAPGMGVPVVAIDKKVVRGYNPSGYAKFLREE